MDAGQVVSEVINEAPAAIKLLEMVVELVKTWSAGSDEQVAQAEAAAQAAIAAMEDARKTTAEDHAKRVADLDAELAPKIEPHNFDTSDVK